MGCKCELGEACLQCRAEAAEKRVGELEGELETERLRLAACGVAAMCNTKETAAKQRIDRNNPYWSGSYGDVCSAVDREMQLREILVSLESENAALRGALVDARDAVNEQECRGDEDCDHCLIVHHIIDPALASPPPAKFGQTLHSEGQIQTPDKLSPATEKQGKVEAVVRAARKVVSCPSCKKSVFCGSELVNAVAALEKEGG